jgi:hypothetical protein
MVDKGKVVNQEEPMETVGLMLPTAEAVLVVLVVSTPTVHQEEIMVISMAQDSSQVLPLEGPLPLVHVKVVSVGVREPTTTIPEAVQEGVILEVLPLTTVLTTKAVAVDRSTQEITL